jgi:hypothetical protein
LKSSSVAQGRLDEEQDPLDQDDRPRLDPPGARGAPVADEVVDRDLHRPAGLERGQVADEELVLQRRRVVEVVAQEVLVALPLDVAVIAVLLEEGDALPPHRVEDRLGDGGLARAGAAGDAEEAGLRGGVRRRAAHASEAGWSTPRTLR